MRQVAKNIENSIIKKIVQKQTKQNLKVGLEYFTQGNFDKEAQETYNGDSLSLYQCAETVPRFLNTKLFKNLKITF